MISFLVTTDIPFSCRSRKRNTFLAAPTARAWAAKEALAAFHKEKGIPQSNQAYISAVSIMAITISGPPSTVRRFFDESPALSRNHRVAIPVYAPYHAEHTRSTRADGLDAIRAAPNFG